MVNHVLGVENVEGLNRTRIGAKVVAKPEPQNKRHLHQLATKVRKNAPVACSLGTVRKIGRIAPPALDHTSGGGSQVQDNGGETVCCLVKCMLGTMANSCTQERSAGLSEKQIADSDVSFQMTHSAVFWVTCDCAMTTSGSGTTTWSTYWATAH